MRSRGWHSYAVAVALLIIQVSVSALGTIGMCVDRPHTHGGVPAPDCLMHNSQPAGTAARSVRITAIIISTTTARRPTPLASAAVVHPIR